MSRIDEVRGRLQELLPELVGKHGVPGAQVAVLVDGEVASAAAGVVNLGTGVVATTDAVFQIGSITKLWTATLVMQLVDEGLLELDRPVREYLPELVLAEEAVAAAVTTRQLLDHTAGFAGDLFRDTGSGADAIEKFVATLGDAGQLFPAGEQFSYNNAGYVVLGRLVEVLRGKSFNQALREHLIVPLGLTHTATDAGEAIRYRAALGHLPGEPPVPAPVWALAASSAPAGSLLSMRAADLVEFARVYVEGGREGVLGADSVSAMLSPEVPVPDVGLMPSHYGLGWGLWQGAGNLVAGHDGGTIGQSAFLRVVPVAGVAVALLTNGGDPLSLYQDLVVPLIAELGEAALPAPPVPPVQPVAIEADRVVGHYDAVMVRYEVAVDADGRCWLTMVPLTEEARMLLPEPAAVELVGHTAGSLITKEPQRGAVHMVLVPLGEPGRPARFLHNSRAATRIEVPV
ncbi:MULTISPECIES: serine hydrolase [unclassified Crossiella]|uniref:serine hydrolase domain-containing protein n=1 Tax=unclassified Crossiella TaxID=2620835 RepID=UPI001FFF50F4|nr:MULTISPECIES: serine hydrolase domain-containing protein [unclassified Crossiella]MCK2242740.1 beta-lactamase family protein [Crossiella sp. S99.2]MCK2256617.1 beta-lactamase family protein [Crossiella sp. S99.1]